MGPSQLDGLKNQFYSYFSFKFIIKHTCVIFEKLAFTYDLVVEIFVLLLPVANEVAGR